MRVLVLGAGALGSLLGARLSRTSAEVTLLSTNASHMGAIQQDGLQIEELDGTVSRWVLPTASDPRSLHGHYDLILVLVKSYATSVAVSNIRDKTDASSVFLTMQNGVGNWERIAEAAGREKVLAGTTAQGATLLESGRIRHGGNGPTYVGEFRGTPTERVSRVVSLFRDAGLTAETGEGMERLVWEKLMINVGINAITALTGIRNGLIAECDAARDLCLSAVQEALSVARCRGFEIPDSILQRVLTVAKNTAVNRSSMGQDVDRRRRTEIDAINGAIVRFGEEAGIATPVNRSLTQLVKILETSFSVNR